MTPLCPRWEVRDAVTADVQGSFRVFPDTVAGVGLL